MMDLKKVLVCPIASRTISYRYLGNGPPDPIEPPTRAYESGNRQFMRVTSGIPATVQRSGYESYGQYQVVERTAPSNPECSAYADMIGHLRCHA